MNFDALVDVLIKAEMDGRPRHEIVLDLGATPTMLLGLGFDAVPLKMTAKTLGKICFDHGIGTGHMKRLPAIVNDPLAVYRSEARPNDAVVLLTAETHTLGPIIIPIARNRTIGRETVNEVVSVYAKEGVHPASKWRHLLLWAKT
jgi:hypothetical protein